MVHKLLTMKPGTAIPILKHVWDQLYKTKPGTAIPILKHVWDQLYKIPEMRVLMNKYWSRDSNLVHIMLDIGKYRGRKGDEKLLQYVNKVKQKYNSL